MPLQIHNLDFLSHNSQRLYPIREGCHPVDTSNTLTIPNSLILSLYLAVPYSLQNNPYNWHISKIHFHGNALSLHISDGSSSVLAYIPVNNHSWGAPYRLTSNHPGLTGHIVIGDINSLKAFPPGEYLFSSQNTLLEMDCIRLLPPLPGPLIVKDILNVEHYFYGDIKLSGKTNVFIEPNNETNTLTISARDATGFNVISDPATPIKTINGIPPDENGNFQILGGACATVEAEINGIRIEDTCSVPCCGCEEFSQLFDYITTLRDHLYKIESVITALSSAISIAEPTLAATRIGSSQCCD